MTALLELDDLAFAYPGSPALRGVSLEVEPGETVALTGPTGSGKSTLLLLAAALLTPASGSVRFAGQNVADLDGSGRARLRRTEIGIVLQFGQLVPDLTVRDNVALPLLLDGQTPRQAHETAAGWIDRVGLSDVAAHRAGRLSGGQGQRAAIARALVSGPRLVLADEPTASLDASGARDMLALLFGAADEGVAVILVTHDNTVSARADREVLLRDGVVEHEISLR
ncbi:ABC transporter ATP-binding protein [Pengzhenrongella sp.]|jgi:putative ABC transport system ATP-binding protein|uniref:ABC transporter ATP-binding protein n=1 Tax=Pengzhenrongella sp. TaxID=2888820 RepID=UPI002F949B3C